jgi:hypothetical protein
VLTTPLTKKEQQKFVDYFVCVNEKYRPWHTPISLSDLQRLNPTGTFEIMSFRKGKNYIIERMSLTSGDINVVAEEAPFRQARQARQSQHLKAPTVTAHLYPLSRYLDTRSSQ